MTDDELCAYWLEVQRVARALQQHYDPIKQNYFTHGTHVPHLHTVIVLRYADDAAPNAALLWRFDPVGRGEDVLRQDVAELARIVANGGT
jgi:diadenosine tetraphosphate (Ap4A) HIT family hydrolase